MADPGVRTQLWRGVVAYRVASLAYAVALVLGSRNRDNARYDHPDAALLVLVAMAAWTVATTVANSRDRGRTWPVVAVDHAVCAALTIATIWVQGDARIVANSPTLTTIWAASPVLGSALLGGPLGGAAGALVQGASSVVVRGEVTLPTFGNLVLLLLAGGVGGYVARLAVASEARLAAAVRLEAANRERQRLARDIHDGVLQVLALVRRRGTELGGGAAELARLAGEQEIALRTLVTTPPETATPPRRARAEDVDLRALLAPYRSETVTVSGPAEPVPLPGHAARELAAAVGAALDNVARHAPGARAWLLVEDLGTEVAVSVRDDGPGFDPGRLEAAAAEGRLGVAASIRGRVADLGGTTTVTSAPGEGTEIELRVPRRRGERQNA